MKNIAKTNILRIPLHLAFGHCHALREGWKEGHFMKTKLLAMMLLAGGSMFAETRLSIGIGFGGHGAGFYQPPPSYASNIPPCPGPDYTWVDGYWSQDYGRATWVDGYWYRQPFISTYQVAPRFDNRYDRDDRRGVARGFVEDRNRGFDQGRYLSGRDRDFGQHQNQNQARGNHDRSNGRDNHQGNGYTNGYRGR